MKKLISALLALVMVFSLATVAFADADVITEGGQDLSDVLNQGTSFTKEYNVKNGTAPAEDFEFEVAYKSFTDNEDKEATANTHPTVTLGAASFADDKAASTTAYTANAAVTISGYENVALGKYMYEITEAPGNTAGVSYVAAPVYLVVTILRDEESNNCYVAAVHYTSSLTDKDKIGSTTNEYDAGQLTVTKQIEGNMADMDKEFTFTITLNAPTGTVFNSTVQNAIDASGVQPEKVEYNEGKTSVTITVNLGDDDSINITNIPVGTTYEVSEDADGYDTEHPDKTEGTIAGGAEIEDVWTNSLTSEVDTGITLDSVPFVIMLVICALAAVLFVTKRRTIEE